MLHAWIALYDVVRKSATVSTLLEKKIVKASRTFDSDFYREKNPDLAHVDDLLGHYIRHGSKEGRWPNSDFETRYYKETYLKDSDEHPLIHYIRVGRAQGLETRDPRFRLVEESGLFDAAFYREKYPDLAGVEDLLGHYVKYGSREGRWPNPEFETRYYQETHLGHSDELPLIHYIRVGREKGLETRDPNVRLIDESGLFDTEFYLEQYPDLAGVEDLLGHYVKHGSKEGRWPNPNFDIGYYKETYLRDSDELPLIHYIRIGREQGLETRDPTVHLIEESGLFDAAFYREKYSDLVSVEDLLGHYIKHGSREGRWPNEHFDPRFYMSLYPDVAESGMLPLVHYIKVGALEDRIAYSTDERQDVAIGGAYVPGTKTIFYEEPRSITRAAPQIDLLAFYLPQFHPIEENNQWWGAGFTEWTNVGKARPSFTGHVQPRLPADLGYYDLRLIDVMQQQAHLARTYGVKGFCFHYYWFGGHRLLERPLDNLLAHPEIDLPFCLCWANENWTRRWDGQEAQILMAQNHSPEDDLAMIADMARYINDSRYYRIGGKPLVIIYRPDILPEPKATIERWRTYCRQNGIGDIIVAGVLSFGLQDPSQLGFDIAVEFPPHNLTGPRPLNDDTDAREFGFQGYIFDYDDYAHEVRYRTFGRDLDVVRTVMPSWDNSARRGTRASIFMNFSPGKYQTLLRHFIDTATVIGNAERPVVMINAWNEWAEAAFLEPDMAFGHAFLNATSRAVCGLENGKVLLPSHVDVPDSLLVAQTAVYEMSEPEPLSVVLGLGREVLEHDFILVGRPSQPVDREALRRAVGCLRENEALGAVVLSPTLAEAAKTGPQERLASLHHEFEFLTGLPPLESEESPEEVSFLNLLLVRTNVLRPVLEHSHALMTDWLPEPRRAEFLLSSLGTLCHRQGFLVRKHNDHDASK